MTQPARMHPTANTPFHVLQQFVMAERGSAGGCICPVCCSRNKVKKYRLTPLHFRILSRLASHGVGENVHWRNFVDPDSATKMLQIPKHYGFIAQNTVNPDNPYDRSGQWHITQLGMDVYNNRCRVPYYFWSIHDAAVWWSNALGTATEISMRTIRDHPADIIEEMSRASLNDDPDVNGQFRVEYL